MFHSMHRCIYTLGHGIVHRDLTVLPFFFWMRWRAPQARRHEKLRELLPLQCNGWGTPVGQKLFGQKMQQHPYPLSVHASSESSGPIVVRRLTGIFGSYRSTSRRHLLGLIGARLIGIFGIVARLIGIFESYRSMTPHRNLLFRSKPHRNLCVLS